MSQELYNGFRRGEKIEEPQRQIDKSPRHLLLFTAILRSLDITIEPGLSITSSSHQELHKKSTARLDTPGSLFLRWYDKAKDRAGISIIVSIAEISSELLSASALAY